MARIFTTPIGSCTVMTISIMCIRNVLSTFMLIRSNARNIDYRSESIVLTTFVISFVLVINSVLLIPLHASLSYDQKLL